MMCLFHLLFDLFQSTVQCCICTSQYIIYILRDLDIRYDAYAYKITTIRIGVPFGAYSAFEAG